jgi:ABC-2 type transport system permease protein
MNDALKEVFGLATDTAPLEVFVYPSIIAAALAFCVCLMGPRFLTAPRLLSPRL